MLLFKSARACQPRSTLFLDRDGVINVDYGYVSSTINFEFMPGIFDLVARAKRAGYFCVVITNQSGIGREYYSIKKFRELTEWMCGEFAKKRGKIDAVYFSPFHPTHGKGKYLKRENSRKPGSGMFDEAIEDLNVDPGSSIMVGDKSSDLVASVRANVRFNYLFSPGVRKLNDFESQSGFQLVSRLSSIAISRAGGT